ncbi:MAG TPA: putative baseplate assembly protein [Candidatus Dormibacteraeota bacterium]|jgi:predicted phage baseplate assembly protein
MPLPVPNLDDRRFQELVNESKRLVQQRCPEWTDHNVHDPGVTLIELFAWMTDQVIYRLNRVPDRAYVKFLELLGVRLFPPTAARAPVTFWLAASQPETVRIPAGTQVATVRTETEEAIGFATVADLDLVPCEFLVAATAFDGQPARRRDGELERGEGFACFSPEPRTGDALLVGLSEAVPSCAVTLRLGCRIEGVGVDPANPPLVWEAWNGGAWVACEVERDETGGLNQDGDVVLHVPGTHTASAQELRQRAGWLRARVVEAQPDQPRYSASPTITRIAAFTSGGTVDAVNAETVTGEALGVSEGVPGQRFAVQRRPVVPGDALVLEVSEDAGWEEWSEVPDFSASGPDDPHFVFDAVAGEVQLGPAVREPDGGFRRYGRTPSKGANLRMRAYRTGGGYRGNAGARALTVLKSSIPYVARVENRRPASGGVDGEDVENAKVRGPMVLRTLGRAVTAEDHEFLARQAAPEVARVRCLPAGDGAEAGVVRVLVVPSAASNGGRLRFEQLAPEEGTVQAIARRLDECRLIGTRVLVQSALYRGVTVVARLRARAGASAARLQEEALDALYTYLNPIIGGPDGTGWPFGRPVHSGEVFAVLQGLRGIELVDDVRLFGADPVTGQRGGALQRLDLEPHALVFSYEHQVLVVS